MFSLFTIPMISFSNQIQREKKCNIHQVDFFQLFSLAKFSIKDNVLFCYFSQRLKRVLWPLYEVHSKVQQPFAFIHSFSPFRSFVLPSIKKLMRSVASTIMAKKIRKFKFQQEKTFNGCNELFIERTPQSAWYPHFHLCTNKHRSSTRNDFVLDWAEQQQKHLHVAHGQFFDCVFNTIPSSCVCCRAYCVLHF